VTVPETLFPENDPAFDVFGASIRVGVSGGETASVYSIVEGLFVPGGFAPIPHVHRNEAESFYVLEGDAEFTVGGEVTLGRAETFLHVPAGTPHGFRNAGTTALRLLFIHAPALDTFFLELADLARIGPLDPIELRLLMDRWGMHTNVE
jgi:mannose-6-phosphate isomerase-like protein (cupin superfamily)